MTLFLMILAIAVIFLLAARFIKNKKQSIFVSDRDVTYDKKRRYSKRIDPHSVSEDELMFENRNQSDQLKAENKLADTEKCQIDDVDKPSPLVILHLLAEKGKPYQGYELLQALLVNNLRHGERKIFHYYYDDKGNSVSTLFSVTSLNKPGTFDLSKMGEFSCDGLIFFAELDQVKNPDLAVNMIMQTAETMMDSLGGSLADERRFGLNDQFSERLAHQVSYYSNRSSSLL